MNRKMIYRYLKKVPRRLGWPRLVRWYNHARFLYRKPYIDVQSVISVEGCGVYVQGWVLGPPSSVAGISFSFSGAQSHDISNQLVWQQDDNLARKFGMFKYRTKPRFIGLIETSAFSSEHDPEEPEFIELHFHLGNGRTRTQKLPVVSGKHAPLAAIESVLRPVPMHAAEKRLWFDKVYGPTLKGIWASRVEPDGEIERVDYNSSFASSSPSVSLVVPIYGRYDFIEYQLSEFVNDPDMRNHEIIYVVDDPRLSGEIRESAQVLERIYEIAFSIIYLTRNLGFAGASNQGAKLASAGKLLMLNSDVMPASKGWLKQLVDSVGDDIDHSITGVRLLYEDDAIQHNGMSFFSSPFQNDLWTNIHPSKGIPNDLVAANDDRFECEAVTGACLLLTKENFFKLDGFDENYILGDYEDSDLCMKARRIGLRITMDDKIVLYHLERLSQSLVSTNRWKEQVTYYNCWLHTSKWDSDIRQLKLNGVTAHG